MHLELGAANDFAGDLVEGGHRRDGGFDPRRLRFALLERRGDDASADGLGEDERVAGSSGGVSEDTVRVDESCDGIPEFDFRIADAVAAEYGAACLLHDREAAAEDLLEHTHVAFLGEADQGKGSEGAAAHSVDVAEGIGRSDAAVGKGIIDHGSKEIDGLHQGLLGADTVDTGVVGALEAYKQVRIALHGETGKHVVERTRGELARAAACFYLLGKSDGGDCIGGGIESKAHAS